MSFGREAEEQRRRDRLNTALELLTAATTVAHAGRESVVMTQYRMRHPELGIGGINETGQQFNAARDTVRLGTARLRVLGPKKLHTAAEDIRADVESFVETMLPLTGPMAKSVTQIDDVESAKDRVLEQVDRFADTVAALVR